METLHHCSTIEVLGHVNTPGTYSGSEHWGGDFTLMLLSNKHRHLFRYFKKRKLKWIKILLQSWALAQYAVFDQAATSPGSAPSHILQKSCKTNNAFSSFLWLWRPHLSCLSRTLFATFLKLEAFIDGKYQQCSRMLAFDTCEAHFNLLNG